MFVSIKIININFLDILRFIRSKIKKNNTSNDSYKNKFIIKLIYSLVFFRFSFKRYKKYSNSLFEYKRYKNGLYFISKSIENNNASMARKFHFVKLIFLKIDLNIFLLPERQLVP